MEAKMAPQNCSKISKKLIILGSIFGSLFLKLWSSVGASWEPSKRQTFQEIDRMARMTHRVAALEQQATRRAGTAQFEEPTPQASPQKNSRGTDQ